MGFPPVSAPGTTLQVGSGAPISGAVILQPGAGIALSRSGQVITARGDAGKRAVDLWIPGVLAAKTLIKLKGWSDPYLTVLDAYFQTAPVGSDAVDNAALKLSGASSGSLEMDFTPDATEFHTNAAASNSLGTNGGDLGAAFADNGKATPWKVNANLTVGGLAFAIEDPLVGASDVRIGICETFGPADGITTATLPWIKDTLGNDAYFDTAVADLVNGWAHSGTTNVLKFDADVDLVNGTEYALVAHRVAAADGFGPMMSDGLYTGAVIAPVTNPDTGTRCLAGTTLWDTVGAPPLETVLLGTILGVPLVGIVTAEIILNGAPTAAQVGSDLRVSFAI